jgi:hypothetical protein
MDLESVADCSGYRAQAGLPTNFDKIPLRKRMQDQLEALGVFSGY